MIQAAQIGRLEEAAISIESNGGLSPGETEQTLQELAQNFAMPQRNGGA